ncbi:hypothetical protein CANINC_000324 [Pichia inconspicua]|uniref:Uncharacterized protein n=1 Tax=Pichia inconspicua TaxID=52247 RepID=A0A4V4NG93_9ASCO|nr:hypothetical protein CANINC_000324 [[Candida] inconspicua]
MFASTISNKPVAIAQPVSPQKQLIEFRDVPIKQLYHLSIFMLPNVQFDPDYTALIYYQILPNAPEPGMVNDGQMVQGGYKLLGYLNATKQSAIFKINPGNINLPYSATAHDEGDIDMDSGISELEEKETVTIVIGISIDANQDAMQQLDCLKVTRDSNSTSLVKTNPVRPVNVPLSQSDILTISNKIIANAYNYLSSFTDANNNVNISRFNDWWDKFKMKMTNDPQYLQHLE